MWDLIDRRTAIDAIANCLSKEANGMSNLVDRSCNTAATLTKADAVNILSGSYIDKIEVGNSTGVIRDTAAHEEIVELREMIEKLKGKPYYIKIQCHNCGATLVIDSSDHIIKCKYCNTAYFSGTQLVNSNI